MNHFCRLAPLALASSFLLAACGGDGDSSTDSAAGATDAQRATAASATAADNAMCTVLGPYYWEIGDVNGVKASGSVGSGAPAANTVMWVFSSSKWLYAANVVQKRGVLDSDVPFLNFTSGYSQYGNIPICVAGTSSTASIDTVQGCFAIDGDKANAQNPATVGDFDYDSGHMQRHAESVMNLAAADDAALAADLNATVGNFGFTYKVPQLAAGVMVSPAGYAQFLRKLLSGGLALGAALGTHSVCANSAISGCNATFTPTELPANENLHYSLGHWIEDDPTVGDGAYSSAGGGGFYPWIDKAKTQYGIVARERQTEAGAGIHSAECGRLIRQAYRTATQVTATVPTPSS